MLNNCFAILFSTIKRVWLLKALGSSPVETIARRDPLIPHKIHEPNPAQSRNQTSNIVSAYQSIFGKRVSTEKSPINEAKPTQQTNLSTVSGYQLPRSGFSAASSFATRKDAIEMRDDRQISSKPMPNIYQQVSSGGITENKQSPYMALQRPIAVEKATTGLSVMSPVTNEATPKTGLAAYSSKPALKPKPEMSSPNMFGRLSLEQKMNEQIFQMHQPREIKQGTPINDPKTTGVTASELEGFSLQQVINAQILQTEQQQHQQQHKQVIQTNDPRTTGVVHPAAAAYSSRPATKQRPMTTGPIGGSLLQKINDDIIKMEQPRENQGMQSNHQKINGGSAANPPEPVARPRPVMQDLMGVELERNVIDQFKQREQGLMFLCLSTFDAE